MKITVLSGAGVSADSGIKTFRDHGGLWEEYEITEVASPQGFVKNPELVLDFYNERRKQLSTVYPNKAHLALAELEEKHEVTIVTQNVDDLHERSRSTKVIHLHGELLKARCTVEEQIILDWKGDLNLGDCCENGHQLRPHIVWFGEAVPLLGPASEAVAEADTLLIVGTSMEVYPAAGLIQSARPEIPIYFVDPNPSLQATGRVICYEETAVTGVPKVVHLLK